MNDNVKELNVKEVNVTETSFPLQSVFLGVVSHWRNGRLAECVASQILISIFKMDLFTLG